MVKIKLALLYGGKSGEHEISLISAASVLHNLDSNKYQIIPIAIDKEGCFYQNNYEELIASHESLPIVTNKSEALPSFLINGKLAVDVDVVFPIVHGPLYEDGCLQGLLELASVAYVGCDVLTSAIGMDKDITRRLVCNEDLLSAQYCTLSWYATAAEKQQICRQAATDWGWPLFVKPCSTGSSVGIQRVQNFAQLMSAVEDALRYDETILIEEGLVGREIEVAVLENIHPLAPPRVSVAGEICVYHVDGFYSYAAKYLQSNETKIQVPANLDEGIARRVQLAAAEIFRRLKCKGLARVDFFVNEQNNIIYFNEINTLPGFTSISMYPKLWQASGLTYSQLLDELVNLAIMHQQCRQQLITNYQ